MDIYGWFNGISDIDHRYGYTVIINIWLCQEFILACLNESPPSADGGCVVTIMYVKLMHDKCNAWQNIVNKLTDWKENQFIRRHSVLLGLNACTRYMFVVDAYPVCTLYYFHINHYLMAKDLRLATLVESLYHAIWLDIPSFDMTGKNRKCLGWPNTELLAGCSSIDYVYLRDY